MAIHHLGMLKEGHNRGRSDMKASKGGGKFGKSGGGKGGLHSKLLSSPMSPGMTPKGGGKQLGGKTRPGY